MRLLSGQQTRLILGACALVMAGTASAADLYVNNLTGNDGTGNGTVGNPFASLTAAHTAAATGDVIKIAATGTPYEGTYIITKSVTIEGNGGKPVLRNPGSTAADTHILQVRQTDVTLKNLSFSLVMNSAILVDRAAVWAVDTVGPYNNLVVDGSDFVIEGNGYSSWRHWGVRTQSNNATVRENLTITNSTFTSSVFSGSYQAGQRAVYSGGKARFSKAIQTTGALNLHVISSHIEGWFRDIHSEIPADLILQSNTFHNSVEINAPNTAGLTAGAEFRIIDNRFLGEYYYEYFYGVLDGEGVSTDQAGAVGYDPDFASIFNPDAPTFYTGDIPRYVAGYQDELLFIKGNISDSGSGTPPIAIERNIFTTRRKGVSLGRSTNVLIKRNSFITDPASLAPLPTVNLLGIVYPPVQHISIDERYIATCCYGTVLPSLEIEIVANDFEGSGSTAVYFGNDNPPGSSAAGSVASPTNFAENIVIAGNDVDPGVVAFENNYVPLVTDSTQPQDVDLGGNFYGGGAPTVVTGAGAGSGTVAPATSGSNLNDSDGDGLFDGEENALYGTNPLLADTDGDGVSDGLEVALARFEPANYDPLDNTKPGVAPADVDGDGVPDSVDPDLASNDGNGDRIKDGYAYAVTYDAYGPVTLGDVNRDGTRTNQDAIQILEVFLGIKVLTGTTNDYDINRDGKVDNLDAVLLFAWAQSNIPYIPFP